MNTSGDQLLSDINIELKEMNIKKVDINLTSNESKESDEHLSQVNEVINELKDIICDPIEPISCKDNNEVNHTNIHVNQDIETKTDHQILSDCEKDFNSNEILVDNKEKENNESISVMNTRKNSVKMTRSEKWGESVGVFNETGVQKRVLQLNEISNYLKLELISAKSEFDYYCSLINERYPRFYDSTIDYFQRWRMRYNVFAGNVFESPDSEALLHIGELHLYFDLIPRYSHPSYVNNSFYANSLPIEIPVTDEWMSQIRRSFDSIRFGKDIVQLKFPIRSQLFNNCNQIFDKFMERQTEFIEEAQIVHRKNQQKRRFRSSARGRAQSFEGFRKFGRNDRESESNDRNLSQNNKGFRRSNRNEVEFGDNKRDFRRNERGIGRNNRGFDRNKRRFGRNNGAFDRDFGTFRDKNADKGMDSSVTFEDTRDRHESDAQLASNKNRSFKRFNHKGMDERKDMRSGSNIERNSYRNNSNDVEFDENRGRNGDSFRGKERRGFSASFTNNQRMAEMASENNSRSNFGNNYRQNNRRMSFTRPELN